MCGIVGLFAKTEAIEERLGAHLGAMLVQMDDRGPDSAGVAVYRDPAPPGASLFTYFATVALLTSQPAPCGIAALPDAPRVGDW